jgi:4-nitrophenyl phosphatase
MRTSKKKPLQDQKLNLSLIDGVVLDMDGVVWRGTTILPGTPDFFLFLREHNIPYALASNNASKNALEYVARAESIGIPIDVDHIVTSALVTVEELARTYPAGTAVYVIGSESLKQLVADSGFGVNSPDAGVAKAVVVGLDVTLTYEKLLVAGRHILAGADFIATNRDVTFPAADGLAPGNGSIVAAIQTWTGHTPRFMGKPEPAMFRTALDHLGTAPERTLMVGDRLDTTLARSCPMASTRISPPYMLPGERHCNKDKARRKSSPLEIKRETSKGGCNAYDTIYRARRLLRSDPAGGDRLADKPHAGSRRQ